MPWYLEQVQATLTADATIQRLAFHKTGLMVREFDRIFHDLFENKGTTYKKILRSLQDGPQTLAEVRTRIAFPHSGTLSQMMGHLITVGFVYKHPLWSFKTTRLLKQSLYAVSEISMEIFQREIAEKKREPPWADLSITGRSSRGSWQENSISQQRYGYKTGFFDLSCFHISFFINGLNNIFMESDCSTHRPQNGGW